VATLAVDVKPEVLVWARESIGLTREAAARKLDMSPLDLQFLEEGVGNVSMARLRKMADAYDRPLIAFFLPEPLKDDDALPDFRLLPEARGKAWTPELHGEFRRVAAQRDVALELSELDDEPVPQIDLALQLGDDPEKAGEQIRTWLRMPLRPVAGTPYEFFNLWASLIEAQAVLVTQVTGVELAEMRGFSIGEHPIPVIALNSKDAIRGRTFTLLHECTHILLRRSALCDLQDTAAVSSHEAERVEWFCNEVAAAVLMSREALLGEEVVATASSRKRWTDEELLYLAGRFGVSIEAMLLRLVTLGKATREYFRERKPFFVHRYSSRSDTGFITYYPKKIRNLGRRYITTVLSAYDRDEITAADLCRYLDIKLKNVPALIERLEVER
jgi:Zn-dependent peptidase ImmA (M78 family)